MRPTDDFDHDSPFVNAGAVILVIVLLAALFLFVGTSDAQTTVQPPRIAALLWDAHGDAATDYDAVYPAGSPLAGQPFLEGYRLTLTPAAGTPVIVNIPRAQVTRRTLIAECPDGSPPCFRATDIAAPFGTFTITLQAVSREGRVSDPSNPRPFTGQGPRPAAPTNLRPPS